MPSNGGTTRPPGMGRKLTRPPGMGADLVSQLLALPPHVGDILMDAASNDAFECVLALTVEAGEARKVLESRAREARSIDRERSASLVEIAIRARLNKHIGEITRKERESITELDLTGTDLTDLTALAGLSGLQMLFLMTTQVSDLTPLAGLSRLQWLDLMGTQVSNLTPLADLSGLQHLDLAGTAVSDLTPLAGLSGLQSLYLLGTPVSDLTPLKHLKNLKIIGP